MEKIIQKQARPLDKAKLLDHLWSKCLTLSIELQYAKSKSKRAEYDALSAIWTSIKNGEFDLNLDIGSTEQLNEVVAEGGISLE